MFDITDRSWKIERKETNFTNRQIKSIKDAYNTLVGFRKLIEDHPELNLDPGWIEGVYKTLWLELFGEDDKPWKD